MFYFPYSPFAIGIVFSISSDIVFVYYHKNDKMVVLFSDEIYTQALYERTSRQMVTIQSLPDPNIDLWYSLEEFSIIELKTGDCVII